MNLSNMMLKKSIHGLRQQGIFYTRLKDAVFVQIFKVFMLVLVMRKLSILIIFYYLVLWFSSPALAVDPKELLQPDEAFQLTSTVKNSDTVLLSWNIATGYYLYRHKVKFASLTPGIETGLPSIPVGLPKHDRFFGDVEIFRDHC